MAFAHGRAETANASRYLGQLCRHWSHRYAVDYDETSGEIPMSLGDCRLLAGPERLEIELESLDGGELDRMKVVVADHLKRFAFREPVELVWTWG